ncbi:MAG: S9 family peptidase [Acidimicrobiales bacterium]
MSTPAPYGTWASPITLDRLVEDVVGLSFPSATGRFVYWTESRPTEGGRQVVVRRASEGGPPVDVFGPGFHARTLVHEYGGRCYVAHDDVVYFSNFEDQRLYRVQGHGEPQPITPEPPSARSIRYAAPVLSADGTHLFAIREQHPEPDDPSAVVNDVVAIATDGSGAVRVITEGHDFYGHVRLSPDGGRVAWVQWDHPAMPWDDTELWEAELTSSYETQGEHKVAGGAGESVLQPCYRADGTLLFVSDRSDWWNLYGADPGGEPPRALAPMDAELGEPDWVFGLANYVELEDRSIVGAWSDGGFEHLGVLRPASGAFSAVPTPFTSFGGAIVAGGDGRSILCVAGAADVPSSVVRITPSPDGGAATLERLKSSRSSTVGSDYISVPEALDYPTEDGLTAHALYYPPRNADFVGPDGEAPPLVVQSHGGPTSAALSELNYRIQFWTSRGFAVVDVNYGGSTGYGRAYRERLRDRWGIVDLDDCVNAALHLASTGRADRRRLLIHGGSAGGYTTLCALTFRDVFAAGASYYGVADAGALARDTHKFESRYLDGLIGPWPEAEALYEERSPLFHTNKLRTPLIVFQGLEDKVVPPSQAEVLVTALEEKGVAYAYIAYPGEQHGFRRAENIIRTTEAELFFYGRVLGFTPADTLQAVPIHHEDRLQG